MYLLTLERRSRKESLSHVYPDLRRSLATAGSGVLQPCPLGYSAAVSGSTSCSPCAVGSYSALLDQASYTACSGGRITPAIGTITGDSCLSPVPNFSIGFLALFFVHTVWTVRQDDVPAEGAVRDSPGRHLPGDEQEPPPTEEEEDAQLH